LGFSVVKYLVFIEPLASNWKNNILLKTEGLDEQAAREFLLVFHPGFSVDGRGPVAGPRMG
jgi:hypothetical protein